MKFLVVSVLCNLNLLLQLLREEGLAKENKASLNKLCKRDDLRVSNKILVIEARGVVGDQFLLSLYSSFLIDSLSYVYQLTIIVLELYQNLGNYISVLDNTSINLIVAKEGLELILICKESLLSEFIIRLQGLAYTNQVSIR